MLAGSLMMERCDCFSLVTRRSSLLRSTPRVLRTGLSHCEPIETGDVTAVGSMHAAAGLILSGFDFSLLRSQAHIRPLPMSSPRAPISPQRAHALGLAQQEARWQQAQAPAQQQGYPRALSNSDFDPTARASYDSSYSDRDLPSGRALTRPPHPGSYAARAAAEADARAEERALQRANTMPSPTGQLQQQQQRQPYQRSGSRGSASDWEDHNRDRSGSSAGSRPGSARLAQRPLALDGGDSGPPLPYYPSRSPGSRPTSAQGSYERGGGGGGTPLPRALSSPQGVQRQQSFPNPIRSRSPYGLPGQQHHQQQQHAAEYPQYIPHPHSQQQQHRPPSPLRYDRPPSPQRYASMQQAVADVQQSRFSSFVPQEQVHERGGNGLARPVSVVVVDDHEVAYSPYPPQQQQYSARGAPQHQQGQIVGLRPRTPLRGGAPPPLPDYDLGQTGAGGSNVYTFEAEEDPAAAEYPLEGAYPLDANPPPTPYEREYSRSRGGTGRKILMAQHPQAGNRMQLSQQQEGRARDVIPPLSPALMGVGAVGVGLSTSSVMSQPGGSTAPPSIFIPASPVGAANGGRGAGIHATPATRAAAAAGFNTSDVGGSPRYVPPAGAGMQMQQSQQRVPLSPAASPTGAATGPSSPTGAAGASGAPAVLPASLSTSALVGHDPTDMDMIVVKIAGCFDPNPKRLLAALSAFLVLILLFVCIAFGVSWHTGVKNDVSGRRDTMHAKRLERTVQLVTQRAAGERAGGAFATWLVDSSVACPLRPLPAGHSYTRRFLHQAVLRFRVDPALLGYGRLSSRMHGG